MQSPAPAEPKEPAKKSGVKEAFEWIEMLACALVFVVFLFSFVFRVVTISGPSMNPTLWDGERVIVTDFFYTPQVGDVIVFTLRGNTEPYIKRILATEGQTVDFDPETASLIVDGSVVSEPYINEQMSDFYLWYDTSRFPLTVPEGQYFVMGDNRNHSLDSRRVAVGCVDRREIVGKAVFILFPFHKIGAL